MRSRTGSGNIRNIGKTRSQREEGEISVRERTNKKRQRVRKRKRGRKRESRRLECVRVRER